MFPSNTQTNTTSEFSSVLTSAANKIKTSKSSLNQNDPKIKTKSEVTSITMEDENSSNEHQQMSASSKQKPEKIGEYYNPKVTPKLEIIPPMQPPRFRDDFEECAIDEYEEKRVALITMVNKESKGANLDEDRKMAPNNPTISIGTVAENGNNRYVSSNDQNASIANSTATNISVTRPGAIPVGGTNIERQNDIEQISSDDRRNEDQEDTNLLPVSAIVSDDLEIERNDLAKQLARYNEMPLVEGEVPQDVSSNKQQDRKNIICYCSLALIVVGLSIITSVTIYLTLRPPTFDAPSSSPSINPTLKPSLLPSTSKLPTMIPSESPTLNPTELPTYYPSKFPTNYPSALPTYNPSKLPTYNPSKFPSKFPTNYPSELPTYNPSKLPTYNPSELPTKDDLLEKGDWSGWVNSPDNPFKRYAKVNGINASFCGIHSSHHDHYEDRVFEFLECRPDDPETLTVNSEQLERTALDDDWMRRCSSDKFITYIESSHSNSREDRTYLFKCAEFQGWKRGACVWSGDGNGDKWVNKYDLPFNFTCGKNKAMTAVNSVHDDHTDDRKFAFECCRLSR